MLPRIHGAGIAPVPQVNPVTRSERGGEPRQAALQRTLATMLGSEVRATVLSRLHDGSFVVRVADTDVRMLLPPGARAGTELPMTVLAAFPQPTFELRGQALPPAMAAWRGGASALGAAPALADATPAAPTTGLAPLPAGAQSASLSSAARLLSDIIHLAQSQPGALGALLAPAPLVAGPVADPAVLARQLQGAIAHSGLFYESHVAQWAEGTRGLAELRAEPQMQQRPGSPLTDPASAQFVNLQLATQEHAHIAWHGQLGPGQQMAWQIDKDAPQAQHADAPAPPGWRSGLRLRFALLGEIEAQVSLHGDRLRIELHTGSDGVASLLRVHAPRLGAALEAAGNPLDALRIASTAPRADD